MSQSPINITYSLEAVLSRLEKKIDQQFAEVNQKIETNSQEIKELKKEINDLKIEVKVGHTRVEEKLDGLSKRLEFQEFISKGILTTLTVAILGGLAKIFGLFGNP